MWQIKPKYKKEKKTALIVCEGEEDSTFLKFLKELYHDSTVATISIKPAHGKSLSCIINHANTIPGIYHKRAVFVDDDRRLQSEIQRAYEMAKKYKIIVIMNKICLEGVMLRILDPHESYRHKGPKECKSIFENKFIPSKYRCDVSKYTKIFTKRLIDKGRAKEESIAKVLTILEAG